MGEFELIRRYFCSPELQASRLDVCVGIGDDCALISVPQGKQLAVSVDTSTAGVHFLAEASAHSIGWRALAVSLSDLAAMGAKPAWFTLAISLPEVNETWLAEFSRGMADLAQLYGVALVGGDTTRGQLSMSVQVQGYVSQGAAWRRKGAKPGDIIYVSGPLGDAAAGLHLAKQQLSEEEALPSSPDFAAESDAPQDQLLKAYLYPVPRFDLIPVLSSRVSSAIDISDGLLADLGHLLTASGVGARLDSARIPLSDPLLQQSGSVDKAMALALSGGDDYQLCFTVTPQRRLELEVSAEQSGLTLYPIGVVTAQEGIRGLDNMDHAGFDHFKGTAS